MYNVAVVLAGGTGQRMGLEIPKQLVKIAGKPIMQHTLQVFQSAPQIDEIIVAMTPGFTADAEAIVAAAGCTKVSRVIEGGATRTETTMRAIEAVGATAPEANVLFHDAVRPFIDHRVIEDCVTALERYEAVDVAIPSADTIIKVDDYGGTVIKDVPRRDLLRRGQTPQCFRLSTIREAYELALADPDFTGGKVTATDDCSVVLRYLPDVPIVVVPGSEQNMKVTHPVDVFLADKLFQLSSQAPPPSPEDDGDYESRLSGKTVVVFGGSQGIGADIAELTRSFGAKVYSFSRSETGTHVENPQDIENALAKAYGETGRIDYVVNTAGVLHTGRLDEIDEAIIDESLRINYLGPLRVARAAIGYLRETKGQLLLYTSSSYTRGRAGYSLYSSAKAATVNLTQALADEWADDGVRVNCINPERTATPMRTRAFGQEPPGTLLASRDVAMTSIDVLISGLTGHTVDIRRHDPTAVTR
ncbi:bifunctional cytidylyltransferase/SDR family oxidoreductase [Actinoallomurus iriomotensis]|uniref:2-C-methyl-D-erythritol 4-phosphate cytidylyltransferase n=1 Tax=Actinoallomurus iriomotensis TaxID=478107 RepID=A0A9W6RJ03_9ACTN|nr:bifunctional cytidylyltransferase/SDR family oxidoreductase [Actinoallomurus iriomotensis]GLY76891.1 pyrophosphorylase [Actinoallomurus iriomotensis]